MTDKDADIRINVEPYLDSGDHYAVRVTAAQREQMQSALKEAGFVPRLGAEFSGDAGTVLLLIQALGAAGVGGTSLAIAQAIKAVLQRNSTRKATFGPRGEVTSLEGMSTNDMVELIEKTRRSPDDDPLLEE